MLQTSRLSHRQQQIIAVLDKLGHATAAEIIAELPDDISNSAVRTHLRLLEKKGYVSYKEEGPRFVFRPTHPRNSAAINALKQVVQTFFGGSLEQTVTALISESDLELSDEEMSRLMKSIEAARKRDGDGEEQL